MSVGDKLVRDVFDYRHHIALDRIGLKQHLSSLSPVKRQNPAELV
jgi:hypothetical protein